MKKKSSGAHDTESNGLIPEYYSHIINNAIEVVPGNVYWKDKNGVYLGCNEAMLKIANVKELKGKTDFDLPWKEEALIIQKTDQETINSNKTIELEETLTLANGQRAIMLTKKTPLHDQEGNIVAILGVSFDISKQREKGNKTQQTPQIVLDSIIADLPGHVYWKDKNGVYLGCNKRQAKSLGFGSSAEIVGKTDFDLPWKKRDASLFRQNDLRIMETGQTETVEETAQMDGRDVIVLSQKSPLRNESGEIIGIVGISLDITSRKMDEESSQRKKEIAEFALAYIIEHLPGHVYWKNKDSVYQGCNLAQAKSAGFSEIGEMIGKTDYDMPWSNEADILRQSDLMVMNTKQELVREEISKMANAEEVSTFLSRKVPFLNKKGEIIGVLGISIDITERKRMEEELLLAKESAEAASKTKTEFLENMRHDIRTPLSGIVGFSEILKMQFKNPQIQEYLDNLIASSQALHHVLDEILEAIRVSSGEIPKLKKKFHLQKTLQAIIDLNRARAAQKKLQLNLEVDPTIPRYLVGDKIRIHRIALELIANALNFTDLGFVKLSAKLARRDEYRVVIKIIVEDTGIGIHKDRQQEIYVQFKRLTPSYQGIYKGAGLGLSVIKQFIDELNGEIYVESEPGEGTTFTCLLPLQEALLDDDSGIDVGMDVKLDKLFEPTYNQATCPEEKPGLAGVQNKHQVLIVEDNEIAQKVAKNILRQFSCAVDLAEDGRKAVELANNKTYDLIFMDIGLGTGIDGYEVTRLIRVQELIKKTHVPIIALTAHAGEENKRRCIGAGMNAVLTKPLTAKICSDMIDSFIPSQSKADEGVEAQIYSTDLPAREADLFNLSDFPPLSLEEGLKLMGDEATLAQILEAFVNESLPGDLATMQKAHDDGDWKTTQNIAHKIKGRVVYIGVMKLKMACQYLEVYWKAGQRDLLESLYQQVITVSNESLKYIQDWLDKR